MTDNQNLTNEDTANITPLMLANTFIYKYGERDPCSPQGGIQHVKLQKLCYYAHGWWLAYHPDQPFLQERPQVWKYGPVFNSLFHVLTVFGKDPIKTTQADNPFAEPVLMPEGRDDVLQLIDWVWNRYSKYTAVQLSNKTHEEGTPWRKIAERHKFRVPKGFEISDDVMAEYFSAQSLRLHPLSESS